MEIDNNSCSTNEMWKKCIPQLSAAAFLIDVLLNPAEAWWTTKINGLLQLTEMNTLKRAYNRWIRKQLKVNLLNVSPLNIFQSDYTSHCVNGT